MNDMPPALLRFFGLWLVACCGPAAMSAEQPAAGAAEIAPAAATPAAATPVAATPDAATPVAASPAATTPAAVTPAAAIVPAQSAQSGAAAFRAAPNSEGPTSGGYLLQPGDILQVSVWKETELTNEVLIRPDGGLSYALAGDMQAAGHTVAELTRMLETRIRKFEPDAVVTISIKSAAGNRVYVIGKVNHPGDFPLNRPTDVVQALSLAGGATPFADTNGIRILRRDGDHQRAIAFRYHDIERGRKLNQNILLQSGDTVVVP
jgi:polysaccharide export outer membrane protein